MLIFVILTIPWSQKFDSRKKSVSTQNFSKNIRDSEMLFFGKPYARTKSMTSQLYKQKVWSKRKIPWQPLKNYQAILV